MIGVEESPSALPSGTAPDRWAFYLLPLLALADGLRRWALKEQRAPGRVWQPLLEGLVLWAYCKIRVPRDRYDSRDESNTPGDTPYHCVDRPARTALISIGELQAHGGQVPFHPRVEIQVLLCRHGVGYIVAFLELGAQGPVGDPALVLGQDLQ